MKADQGGLLRRNLPHIPDRVMGKDHCLIRKKRKLDIYKIYNTKRL
jgi:hypothetical protein